MKQRLEEVKESCVLREKEGRMSASDGDRVIKLVSPAAVEKLWEPP